MEKLKWSVCNSKILNRVNPFRYSDGLSHTHRCSKSGIVHYIFQGVTGRNFLIMCAIVFYPKNSADPDEMPHCVAFHLCLHGFLNYLILRVSNIQKVNVLKFQTLFFLILITNNMLVIRLKVTKYLPE